MTSFGEKEKNPKPVNCFTLRDLENKYTEKLVRLPLTQPYYLSLPLGNLIFASL